MAGNWKMYKMPAQTSAFFEEFRPLVAQSKHCEIVICAPFTNLAAAVEGARGTRISVGAQNVGWAEEGAFTGEVSGAMIRATGATHVIVGHSERRQYFCETDETVLLRTRAALESGLTPIVCVGERLEEREAGLTEEVLWGLWEPGERPHRKSQRTRTGRCGARCERVTAKRPATECAFSTAAA